MHLIGVTPRYGGAMAERRCSRPACPHPPAASMSYDYGAATVFVGRLADERHPSLYDLCRLHLDNLTPPRGWTLRREPLVAVGGGADDQWADTPVKAGSRNAI